MELAIESVMEGAAFAERSAETFAIRSSVPAEQAWVRDPLEAGRPRLERRPRANSS